MSEDVYVYCINLPEGINEMIAPCDGGYTLYIDKRLSEDGLLRAYHHAVLHVSNNDWDKPDVQTIERTAHERQREEDRDRLSVPSVQFRFAD